MIERTPTVIRDNKPGHTFPSDRQVFYVRTDEDYVVQPLDRVVVVLHSDVNIITDKILDTPDFYCWIIDKDANMLGLWVEDGQLKVFSKHIDTVNRDSSLLTENFIAVLAQSKPSLQAPFLTVDSFNQAITNIPLKYGNHSHTITYPTPSHTHTTTHTIGPNYTISVDPAANFTTTATNTSDLVTKNYVNSVAMTSNGNSWNVISS